MSAVSAAREERSASGAIFLSPHNDDETLFGAFTLLRERPRVVTVLRSYIQEQRGTGVTYREREAETEAALDVLGIADWEQWQYPDSDPPWHAVRERLGSLEAERIYAPAVERGGHRHHNAIGRLADSLWPGRVTFYTTYKRWGRGRTTRGNPVPGSTNGSCSSYEHWRATAVRSAFRKPGRRNISSAPRSSTTPEIRACSEMPRIGWPTRRTSSRSALPGALSRIGPGRVPTEVRRTRPGTRTANSQLQAP